MRKGILSLSSAGRGKSAGRKKTTNMELAEQTTAKSATVDEPLANTPPKPEKLFVQTIQVPKQPDKKKVQKKHKRNVMSGQPAPR